MPRLPGLGLSLIVAFAVGIHAGKAGELNLKRSVRPDVMSILAYVRYWDSNCQSLPANATITKPPANGVASVKAGWSILPDTVTLSGNTGRCAGAVMIGRQIMYRSNPGFRGSDAVTYEMIGPTGNKVTTTIAIAVR